MRSKKKLFLLVHEEVRLPIEALGAYCISMSRATSDILAVVLLQKIGGVKKFMRVSPLFETRDDLIAAPKVIDAAFSVPWYLKHIKGNQEVPRTRRVFDPYFLFQGCRVPVSSPPKKGTPYIPTGYSWVPR